MDGHEYEGLSDQALAREIEAALGVDPSPEFLPRVRARIAMDRADAGVFWAAPWRWASAVAVATAVVVASVWMQPDQVPASREERFAPPGAAVRPPIEPARPAPVAEPAVRVVHTKPRPSAVTPFEVVISPDESAALRQLFTAINNRQIETLALPDLASALKPPAPIEEIVLEPISISPLAALEGE